MANQQAANERRAVEASAIWTKRKPEIERLYLAEGWSQKRLATHYGVTQQALQKVMKRLAIPPKSRGRSGQENGRFKDGTKSTAYRAMIAKSHCNRCGSTEQLLIHHKDGVHTNNTPDNLEVLCSPCHSSHHKQEWWDARRASAS